MSSVLDRYNHLHFLPQPNINQTLIKIYYRLLLHTDTSWAGAATRWGKFLQMCHKADSSSSEFDSDIVDITSSNESSKQVMKAVHNNMTMTTVISNGISSPQKVVMTRTLPQRISNVQNLVGTKFGTARLFNNPLDTTRPDIIYHHPHHYDDFQSDNVYETISHCKNVKNSVI